MDSIGTWSEFSDVLRSSLQTTLLANNHDDLAKRPDFPVQPGLLDAIHFSRRFVPTYYLVLTFVILVTSGIRLNAGRSRRSKLQRNYGVEEASPKTLSSASSTLVEEQSGSPKDGLHTESTPLLAHRVRPESDTSSVGRLRARLLALLTYQPKPIPAVTARFNQLPSNGSTLLITIFLAVNAFYLFYNTPVSLSIPFAFGYRAGLCFVANLPVLYILGAKNSQPLKWLTGWSYEKLNIFHRRLGEWMVVLGILHSVAMILTWYNLIRPIGFPLAWFLSRPVIILGLGAAVSYISIWTTSIGYVREKFYEFFLASHIILQVAALVFVFLHSKTGRPYCGAALAIWSLDRVVSRFFVSSTKFTATLEIAKDKETVLLYCDIPIDLSKRGDIRSGWKAGQHVFLSVPALRWDHAYQAHPFTIASPAPHLKSNEMNWPMQLIIRSHDGFSKELLDFAQFHQHVEIYLDGPYGDSEIVNSILSADKVCLIAGGSGITVTYPLAWVSWSHGKEASIISSRTVYKNGKKQTKSILLEPPPVDKCMHFWVRQISEHSSWMTMFPARDTGLLMPSEASHGSRVVDLITQTFETRQDAVAVRPDIATEVRVWLENSVNRTAAHPEDVCMVVSGPDGLVRDVRNCAAAMIKAGYNIELHVEKFGW